MGGLFSALGSFWSLLVHIFDPLCGPVGIFTWFGQSTILACGDTGWGDEIALGLQVTVSVAVVTLPIGLVIGFLVALGQQSEEKSLRLAAGVYTTIFRGLPELLTLFIIYYGMPILIQYLLDLAGYNGPPVEITAFLAGVAHPAARPATTSTPITQRVCLTPTSSRCLTDRRAAVSVPRNDRRPRPSPFGSPIEPRQRPAAGHPGRPRSGGRSAAAPC